MIVDSNELCLLKRAVVSKETLHHSGPSFQETGEAQYGIGVVDHEVILFASDIVRRHNVDGASFIKSKLGTLAYWGTFGCKRNDVFTFWL